jgi:hypothetical protein
VFAFVALGYVACTVLLLFYVVVLALLAVAVQAEAEEGDAEVGAVDGNHSDDEAV